MWTTSSGLDQCITILWLCHFQLRYKCAHSAKSGKRLVAIKDWSSFAISVLYLRFSVQYNNYLNPFTPKSDQLQISPAASPERLHNTVWRTWLFTAYSDERRLHHQLTTFPVHFSWKGWENVRFDLMGVKGLNMPPDATNIQEWIAFSGLILIQCVFMCSYHIYFSKNKKCYEVSQHSKKVGFINVFLFIFFFKWMISHIVARLWKTIR